jgi:hypothetical protein
MRAIQYSQELTSVQNPWGTSLGRKTAPAYITPATVSPILHGGAA